MSLGAKIKELRVKTGKSLQDVADEIGSSKAHVWELEAGRSKNPSIELLTKLATSLNATVAELIGETPPGQDEEPQLVAMYRDLKTLTPKDREAIQGLMQHLKRRED